MLFSIIALILILTVIVFFCYYYTSQLNPYVYLKETVVKSHENSLFYGTQIEVYDDNNVSGISRLLLIKPTNIIIYNLHDTVYAYLQNSVGSTCSQQEFPVIAINRNNISDIENGVFNIVCSTVSEYNLLNHFVTASELAFRINPSYDTELFTIIDVINYGLATGVLNFNS
uniref:Occlusion-derived virus envelope protein 56 per os infectivity factor 4 n=1 Tax=Nesodiprion zhejiangensis nucleopolyhedrovirus TaxID=3135970 RepID=A0AAN0LHN0_9BACU